ncbi:MAG TPA: fibronectin type III domain-containing protein, partial [Solirubrobacteraceae bacterium]|nr:fibronectin type III domain-containing protein [Solirubrobacteraceae bacterium]
GYGQQTPTQSAGAGTADVPVSATVTGLTAGTTYHYRLTATNASGPVPGADQTFVTVGTRAASTLAVTVKPAGGDTDLGLNLTLGTDAAGTPAQALAIGEAISSQFVNQLPSFGTCTASAFNNLQGPTAANCADRSAIVGAGTLVVRNQAGADTTSDQGFLVKTAPNAIVFWWHTPAPTAGGAQGFGQVAGLVTQETGTYGPVVTYDFSGLPTGSRVKQLNLTYQRNPVTGKAPFAATSCTGASQAFQARIAYLGGVASELPAATVACALPPAPQPSKLALARATITGRVIDILAPISRRASGNVSLDLYSAGQHARWTAAINSTDGRIRDTHVLPASMANNGGTGILTIRYAGNAVTRPQVVRLRAGSVPAVLDASRPTLDAAGHLHAQGTISAQAHGVVRVQLEYFSAGQTTTLEKFATISGGAWSLDATLTAAQQAAVAARQGPVESYILFTGYFPRRMRGEMVAYQVLPGR